MDVKECDICSDISSGLMSIKALYTEIKPGAEVGKAQKETEGTESHQKRKHFLCRKVVLSVVCLRQLQRLQKWKAQQWKAPFNHHDDDILLLCDI